MAKIIERAREGYEVEEVAYGKVYAWRPESVVVECECGQETALTQSETACEGCGAEHRGSSGRNCPTDNRKAMKTSTPGAIRGTARKTERCRSEDEGLGLVP